MPAGTQSLSSPQSLWLPPERLRLCPKYFLSPWEYATLFLAAPTQIHLPGDFWSNQSSVVQKASHDGRNHRLRRSKRPAAHRIFPCRRLSKCEPARYRLLHPERSTAKGIAEIYSYDPPEPSAAVHLPAQRTGLSQCFRLRWKCTPAFFRPATSERW